jgi:DNA-directed RNA polymerase subunit L
MDKNTENPLVNPIVTEPCGEHGFTYTVPQEDHTLGNLCKIYIRKAHGRESVAMASYTKDHPSDEHISLTVRITPEGATSGNLTPHGVLVDAAQSARNDFLMLKNALLEQLK